MLHMNSRHARELSRTKDNKTLRISFRLNIRSPRKKFEGLKIKISQYAEKQPGLLFSPESWITANGPPKTYKLEGNQPIEFSPENQSVYSVQFPKFTGKICSNRCTTFFFNRKLIVFQLVNLNSETIVAVLV